MKFVYNCQVFRMRYDFLRIIMRDLKRSIRIRSMQLLK